MEICVTDMPVALVIILTSTPRYGDSARPDDATAPLKQATPNLISGPPRASNCSGNT